MNPSSRQARALSLLETSLSWEYFSGSRYQNVQHPETGWRLLPFMVIVCPTEGVYSSDIEGIGRIEAQPGEALLVPRNVRHTVAMPDGGVLHHAHILFTVFNSTAVTRFLDVPPLASAPIGKEIGNVTRDLHAAMENPPDDDTEEGLRRSVRRRLLSSRLLDLITSISTFRETARECLLEICRIEPALAHMEQHLAASIRRSELAELVSLSETRFHYVFKNAVGLAPMAYLKNLRMRKAQLLLSQTDLQVSEVGRRVGYPDVFHFSKTFKRAFAVTPSLYRADIRRWLLETN